MKKIYIPILCGALLFSTSSCSLFEWAALSSNASNETKGAVVGAASGARTGAFIGSLFGHGYHQSRDNSLIGAAIGVVAGAAVGAAVGSSIDKENEKANATYSSGSNSYDETYDNTRYYSPSSNSLYFKEKKVSLTKDAKKNLDYVAQKLISDPTAVVEVYGHTDNSQDANTLRRISVERATEVKGYLLKKGVPSNQIYCQGCADQYPVASNSTEEGRAKNRRVELIITHPGTDNAVSTDTISNSAIDNSTVIR